MGLSLSVYLVYLQNGVDTTYFTINLCSLIKGIWIGQDIYPYKITLFQWSIIDIKDRDGPSINDDGFVVYYGYEIEYTHEAEKKCP